MPQATYPSSVGATLYATHAACELLFGLAPSGVCHAIHVTMNAVRFYRTISPLPQIYH